MNIFSPPTDSLYKFLAISGVLVSIFFGYTILNSDDKAIIKKRNHISEFYNVNAEIKVLDDQILNHSRFREINDTAKNNVSYLLNAETNIFYSEFDEKYKKSVYEFPENTQRAIHDLVLKKQRWETRRIQLEKEEEHAQAIIKYLWFGYVVGLVVGASGFLFWYLQIQGIQDDDIKRQKLQNKLGEVDFQYCCQSCYKTFLFINERGIEIDGTYNKSFCNECYSKGEYSEPELSFSEAKKRMVRKLRKLDYGRIQIYIKKRKMKHLLRWKRLRTL